MYTREILPQPEGFVKNGKPVFGSFSGIPKKLDIRGVRHPYGDFPLPVFFTNFRIKSRLNFYFTIGDFIGQISFLDAKVFGFAEVIIWNKNTKQKYRYKSLMGPRRRFVPHKMECASTSSYRRSRYIRISWDKNHDRISVVLNLKGNSVRPGISANFSGTYSCENFAQMTFIKPAPTVKKCSGIYNSTFDITGNITFTYKNSEPQFLTNLSGSAFFDINRTYMKFKSHGEFITGIGNVRGKPVTFRIEATSQDAVDTLKYNSNVLFYNGKATPLPPVRITHPFGITSSWVIQDTENMVDLTFTPVSDSINKISILILRAVYHTVYGTLEGTLLTEDGEKISFKSLTSICQKYSIRL